MSHEEAADEGPRLLSTLVQDLSLAGCRTRRLDVYGDFVAHILRYVQALGIDLILVSGGVIPGEVPPGPQEFAPLLIRKAGCPVLVDWSA
jgi:hypothetical protein